MKKIFFPIIAFAIMLFAIISCDSTEFTEDDALANELELIAYKDSLAKHGIIEYSVKVFNASENSTAGSTAKSANDAGLTGVVVTIAQYGNTVTDTTDAAGLAVFEDLRVGAANVTVTADGYTDVSFVADITPNDAANSTASNKYYMASSIAVFALEGPTNATLTGRMTLETDLTNKAPEIASNITVSAYIDVNNAAFAKYIMRNGTDYMATIQQISYEVYQTPAVTNEQGEYSISVPSSPDGVPYQIKVSDFATNQSLLLNTLYGHDVFGVQSVRTIFSSDAAATSIPTVAPAYVTIDMPNGATNRLPTTVAQGTAVVTKSGVEAIHITNPGDLYTQAPTVEITSTGYGEGAEATATIDAQGRVNDIVVTTPGIGYTATNASVALIESAEHAELEAVFESSVSEITVSNKGNGYVSTPNVTIYPTQNGATAQAVMSSVVDAVNVTANGSKYIQVPDVIISGGGGTGAKATAVLSTRGPIASIDITSTAANYPYYLGNPTINVTFTSTFGNGASGTGVLGTTGRVQTITMSNNGSGYTSTPPAVTITGNGAGALAIATMIDDGTGNGTFEVDYISIYFDGTTTHYGSGYSSATVQIAAPPTGGTQAAATANIAFPLQSITINNAGSAYDAATAIILSAAPDAGAFAGNVVINKSVESITVTDGGSDYSSDPTVVIIAKDGDSGTGATATATRTQVVDEIMVTNPGSGFESGNIIVSIDPPAAGGVQAVASVTGTQNILTAVNVIEGGSGYTAMPYINSTYTWVTPGSTDNMEAEIALVITGGAVTAANVVNAGFGISSVTFGLSTYRVAATAKLETNPDAGKIEQINITVPGEGYTVAPIVEIDDLNGVASGAVAEAEISNGKVVNVTITNAGTGYYKAPAIKFVVPNYNTKAVASVNVNEMGVITSINVEDAGMGYDAIPNVAIMPAISGMGTGASAKAVVANGKVTRIDLLDGGSGFLGQNTPGMFGGDPSDVGSTTAGRAMTAYNMEDNVVVSGETYIVDYYLGTGKRIEEY
jgi:hypothetical protein